MGRYDKPILVFQTDFTYAEGAVSSIPEPALLA